MQVHCPPKFLTCPPRRLACPHAFIFLHAPHCPLITSSMTRKDWNDSNEKSVCDQGSHLKTSWALLDFGNSELINHAQGSPVFAQRLVWNIVKPVPRPRDQRYRTDNRSSKSPTHPKARRSPSWRPRSVSVHCGAAVIPRTIALRPYL